jgi:hypothetical protein
MQRKEKAGSVIFRLFLFLLKQAPTVFSDMDFTVAAPFGAFGWEPSLDRIKARVAPISQLSSKAVDVSINNTYSVNIKFFFL